MNESILELNDIHKAFGDKKVHQGVNFSVNAGEKIGLLGSSGTGKSVLLRSIIGLEYIDEGKIYFHGKRIDNLGEKELAQIRNKISYSFQSGALFDSMTVFENLAFPLFEHTKLSLREIYTKVQAVLKLIDMQGSERLMPSDLSGGMQKRVGMARSMILGPEIILYDEPTAGLDPSNTVNVINVMKNFSKQGITSIFVSHDIPAVKQFCDRIIILDHGKVVFDQTIDIFNKSTDPVVTRFLIEEGFKNAN